MQAATPGHGELTLTLDIPAELPVFDGHFDAHPVVPGVAQIDWAVHFARQHLGCTGNFHAMQNIKFTQVITPPARVDLRLEWNAPTHRLAFRYAAHANQRTYSSGTLCFSA